MPRMFEASVTLGLAAALALAAATSSLAQTRQNSPRNAPAAQQADPAAQQSGQCWISSEDNDRGNFGYWGPCSNPKARQVR
jgi:hypothetical protein